MVSVGRCVEGRGIGEEKGAGRGCDQECACGRAWGPCCWGRPWFGGEGRTLISLESGLQSSHPARNMQHGVLRLQSSREGPSPTLPLLAAFRARGRAAFPPPSLPLSGEKAGAGRRRRQKTHAQPLLSRLTAAGTASAVCACALSYCGFNSFWVCPQLDPGLGLMVNHRISTILNQLLLSCNLSRDLFTFNESNSKYGEYFLNCILQIVVFQRQEVQLSPVRNLCGTR